MAGCVEEKMFWNAVSAVSAVASAVVAIIAVVMARNSVREMGRQNDGLMEQLQLAIKANEIAIRANDRDEQRFREELARFDEEHARSFSVWSEFISRRLHPDTRKPDDDEKLVLKLHNGSSIGIRDINIGMDLGTGREPKIYYAAPKQKFLPQTLQGPKSLELEPTKVQRWRDWCSTPNRKNYEPNIEAIFTDGSGHRWLQMLDGDLRKVDCNCMFPAWWLNAQGQPFPNGCRCTGKVLNSRPD